MAWQSRGRSGSRKRGPPAKAAPWNAPWNKEKYEKQAAELAALKKEMVAMKKQHQQQKQPPQSPLSPTTDNEQGGNDPEKESEEL